MAGSVATVGACSAVCAVYLARALRSAERAARGVESASREFEAACVSMDRAAKEMETAAKETEAAAKLFQQDLPPVVDSVRGVSNAVSGAVEGVVRPVTGAVEGVVRPVTGAGEYATSAVTQVGTNLSENLSELAGAVGQTTNSLARDLTAVAELVTTQRAARETVASDWFWRMSQLAGGEDSGSDSDSEASDSAGAAAMSQGPVQLSSLSDEERAEVEKMVSLAAEQAVRQGPDGATRILELSSEVMDAMARAEEAEERVLKALESIEAVTPSPPPRATNMQPLRPLAAEVGTEASDSDSDGYEPARAPGRPSGGFWRALGRR